MTFRPQVDPHKAPQSSTAQIPVTHAAPVIIDPGEPFEGLIPIDQRVKKILSDGDPNKVIEGLLRQIARLEQSATKMLKAQDDYGCGFYNDEEWLLARDHLAKLVSFQARRD